MLIDFGTLCIKVGVCAIHQWFWALGINRNSSISKINYTNRFIVSSNTLVTDEPLAYARIYLERNMQIGGMRKIL